ncbi:ABC transporter permease subunit [Clostridium tarantellae]|uniref:ABC transporter permease subunit n=1 Tax=Clostridium tarantellae TaxID=39493 RepID=A0A6I1MSQ8_9CLOT|nr:ABC transporter permease subunit [Clostridium tarantellae]
MIEYKDLMIKAYITTIEISIIALILSILWGIILFFMSISKKLYFNYFFYVYTQISLGVPLLVHVIVLYFFLASALGINNPILGGTLILSGYMASYFSKTFQGAYNSLDKQQFNIMHTLQLPKKTRIFKIIAPQIIENTLPTLTSHFSLLIKSTALLSLISVPEFTNFVNVFNSKTFEFITGYLLLAIGYLLITIPLSYIAKYLSKKVGLN